MTNIWGWIDNLITRVLQPWASSVFNNLTREVDLSFMFILFVSQVIKVQQVSSECEHSSACVLVKCACLRCYHLLVMCGVVFLLLYSTVTPDSAHVPWLSTGAVFRSQRVEYCDLDLLLLKCTVSDVLPLHTTSFILCCIKSVLHGDEIFSLQ